MADKTDRILNKLRQKPAPKTNNLAGPFILPNNSGTHAGSIKREAPVSDMDLVNKKYVDDNAFNTTDPTFTGTVTISADGDESQLIIKQDANQSVDKPSIDIQTDAGDSRFTIHSPIASTTLIGLGAGTSLNNISGTNGRDNVFIGRSTGNEVTAGYKNTYVGNYAGQRATTGKHNVFLGNQAGRNATTGSRNVGVGFAACQGAQNFNPINNVAIGYNALLATRSSTGNIAIGTSSGTLITTGSYNILIGQGAQPPAADSDYYLNIGKVITGDITPGAGSLTISCGGSNALTISSDQSINAVKSKLTPIGGFAIKLTNTTGATSIVGQLVKADPATDDAYILCAAGDVECIGVVYDAVADDAEGWVVVAGIADVAHDDNVAAVRGNWVSTGVLAGYAATATSPAAAPTHFEEIGHCIESVSAGGVGTHILARCVLHFN